MQVGPVERHCSALDKPNNRRGFLCGDDKHLPPMNEFRDEICILPIFLCAFSSYSWSPLEFFPFIVGLAIQTCFRYTSFLAEGKCMVVGGGSCYLLAHLILIPCVSIEKKERNGTATAAVCATSSKNVRNVSSEICVCSVFPNRKAKRVGSSHRAEQVSFLPVTADGAPAFICDPPVGSMQISGTRRRFLC